MPGVGHLNWSSFGERSPGAGAGLGPGRGAAAGVPMPWGPSAAHPRPCPQLGEAQAACGAAKQASQQLRRRCRRLACELEDARVLAESQQSRSHELEKRQKK